MTDSLIEREDQLNFIANHVTRSDKMSWERKYKNMQKELDKLRPVEDQLLELQAKKQKFIDVVTEIRLKMVEECIHPREYLIHNGDHIVCKFCEKRLGLPNASKTKS